MFLNPLIIIGEEEAEVANTALDSNVQMLCMLTTKVYQVMYTDLTVHRECMKDMLELLY